MPVDPSQHGRPADQRQGRQPGRQQPPPGHPQHLDQHGQAQRPGQAGTSGQSLPPVAMYGVDTSQYGVPEVYTRDVPGWNRHEDSLFRGDTRSPAQVRADGGFRPPYFAGPEGMAREPSKFVADIAQHVGGNTNAFVSTSTDVDVAQDFAGLGHVYVVNAPGGIYTDPTLERTTGKETHGEGEVLFPGGIDWRYVRGWHEMRYEPGTGYVMGEFQPNPDYIGDRATTDAPSDQPASTRPDIRSDTQPHPQEHPDSTQPDQGGPQGTREGQYGDASRPAEPGRQDTLSIAERLGGEERPASLGDRMGRLDDPRLDALRPHLRSTEGGMSAFAPSGSDDHRLHQNELHTASQVPRIPGQFVVDTHGTPDSVRIGDTRLSPRDLADVIRANPDYDGGPVSLLGCNTGGDPDGFAARLAQELGVPVTAPTRDAWVDNNGNVIASSRTHDTDPGKPAKPVWPPNGEWNTYSPNGEQTTHRSPYPPGHTPTWDTDSPSSLTHRGDDRPQTWDDGEPADIMQQMVDQELRATWANYDYDNRAFQDWLQSPTEGPLPEIRPETRINCWEMVMYAAVVSGQLSHADAHRIYDFVNTPEGRRAWFGELPGRLAPAGRHAYDPDGLQRGELVFWDGHEHIALATGGLAPDDPRDPNSPVSPGVYTFWPPPDTHMERTTIPGQPDPKKMGWATPDRVKIIGVQGLTDFINRQRAEENQEKDEKDQKPPVVVEVGVPMWAGGS